MQGAVRVAATALRRNAAPRRCPQRNFTATRALTSQLPAPLPSVVALDEPTPAQRALFAERGYLIVPSVVDPAAVSAVSNALDAAFRGHFQTTIYPDEWHWREEISRADATRHMTNAWKCDGAIATLVLDANLGRFAAQLMGWPAGARLGNDSVWLKPPGQGGEVAHHRGAWKSRVLVAWAMAIGCGAACATRDCEPMFRRRRLVVPAVLAHDVVDHAHGRGRTQRHARVRRGCGHGVDVGMGSCHASSESRVRRVGATVAVTHVACAAHTPADASGCRSRARSASTPPPPPLDSLPPAPPHPTQVRTRLAPVAARARLWPRRVPRRRRCVSRHCGAHGGGGRAAAACL